MKSQYKNRSGVVKKNMNITTHFVEGVKNSHKKNTWKSKTSKMTKTITGKTLGQKPNMMTQDDIQKLFRNNSKEKQNVLGPTKVSTEGYQGIPILEYRDFVGAVKFLQVDDQADKFLSGLPINQGNNCVGQLFQHQNQSEDLTTLFKKNYSVGKVIGQGAYATVRVAIYKPTQKKVALKIYQKIKIKDVQRKKSVRRQVKILQLLNHPNIVKIYDVVQTNNHLNIAMQYLPGLSLGTYLKAQPNGKIPQKVCKKIFRQLAKALGYMHELNIAHRDIKLQNIILDEDISPKLIDFGFSTCIQSHHKIKIFCGTPSYMAPEVVQRKQYRGQTADVWALGVLLFVSLTGIFPFKGQTDQQLFKKISQSDYSKGQLLFSRNVSDLISKMLKVNPDQRIKANQLVNHSWFTQSKGDSNKKRNIQSSFQNRKRVYTIHSQIDKDSKQKEKQRQKDPKSKSKQKDKDKQFTDLKQKSKKTQKLRHQQLHKQLQKFDRQIQRQFHKFDKTEKMFLAQTCKQNLNLQLRLALKSPTNNNNKQIKSFRKKTQDHKQDRHFQKQRQKQKQNLKFSLKNQKHNKGGIIKQSFLKQHIKQREHQIVKKKQKLLKTQPKLVQFLKMQLKKKNNQNSKSKSNTHTHRN